MIQELKIVDKDAKMLHTALGITDERSDELCKQLDNLTVKFSKRQIMYVEIINEIIKICKTDEEIIFCIITNTIFIEKNKI